MGAKTVVVTAVAGVTLVGGGALVYNATQGSSTSDTGKAQPGAAVEQTQKDDPCTLLTPEEVAAQVELVVKVTLSRQREDAGPARACIDRHDEIPPNTVSTTLYVDLPVSVKTLSEFREFVEGGLSPIQQELSGIGDAAFAAYDSSHSPSVYFWKHGQVFAINVALDSGGSFDSAEAMNAARKRDETSSLETAIALAKIAAKRA